jgi:outer membrane protein TolC
MLSPAVLFCLAAALDWQDPKSVVEAALTNNPTLARLEREVAAARERIAPAGSQPNPMLMAGVQNKEIDLSDDEMMTMYMVGAQQTIARGGRREARRTIAELEARVFEQQIVSARAEIERAAIFAWYDLAAADSQIHAAEQVRGLIDAIIDAARVRYEVGTSIQADVIRSQLEKSNLEHQILSLRGARNAALARLLPLVGLSPSTEVPPVHLPHATGARELDAPTTPPASHPALATLATEVERQNAQIRLARLLGTPDITLEASYGYRRTQRDMFSVVASVEIPFRRDTLIEPRVREAIARREAAERQIEELRRDLTSALAAAVAYHEQANAQLKLHDEVLVPQAKLAFESTLTAYQTGKTNFDAVLAAESTYLRLQLDYYQYLAEHIKAVEDFEAIRRGARGSLSMPGSGSSGRQTPSSVASSPAASPQMSGMQP